MTSSGQVITHLMNRLTSMMSRLVRPRQTGRIQVESGKVRSGNHRVPPAVRSDCSTAENTVQLSIVKGIKSWSQTDPGSMGVYRTDPGSVYQTGPRPAQSQCQLTGLVQTQVSEGQREADPQGQLNPDQQTGFEGVTVVSDVELRNNTTQIFLELEPDQREQHHVESLSTGGTYRPVTWFFSEPELFRTFGGPCISSGFYKPGCFRQTSLMPLCPQGTIITITYHDAHRVSGYCASDFQTHVPQNKPVQEFWAVDLFVLLVIQPGRMQQ